MDLSYLIMIFLRYLFILNHYYYSIIIIDVNIFIFYNNYKIISIFFFKIFNFNLKSNEYLDTRLKLNILLSLNRRTILIGVYYDHYFTFTCPLIDTLNLILSTNVVFCLINDITITQSLKRATSK